MFCVFTTSASQDKLSITLTGSHLLSRSYLPNYMKTCSFLHANITENIKIVEKLVKKQFIMQGNVVDVHSHYTL